MPPELRRVCCRSLTESPPCAPAPASPASCICRDPRTQSLCVHPTVLQTSARRESCAARPDDRIRPSRTAGIASSSERMRRFPPRTMYPLWRQGGKVHPSRRSSVSLRRHVLQVVALVTAVALVFGAFAGSAVAKKMSKSQKAKVRAELRKQVKKNPGVVKRRSFLRKAALVNFKLPVTIRLRNPCQGAPISNPGVSPSAVACRPRPIRTAQTQGTALNQSTIPSAQRQPRSVARYAFGRARWRAVGGRRVQRHL